MSERSNKPRGPFGWLVEQFRSSMLTGRDRRSIVLWPGHLLFLIPTIFMFAVVFALPFLQLLRQLMRFVRDCLQ